MCETAFASGGHELDDRPVRVEGLVQGVDADLAFDALDVLGGLDAFGCVVELNASTQARRRIRRLGLVNVSWSRLHTAVLPRGRCG